jgi:hypothetical protein
MIDVSIPPVCSLLVFFVAVGNTSVLCICISHPPQARFFFDCSVVLSSLLSLSVIVIGYCEYMIKPLGIWDLLSVSWIDLIILGLGFSLDFAVFI